MSGGLAGRAHPFTAGSVSLAMVLLAVLVPAPNGPPLLYAAVCLVALLTGVGRAVRHGMLLAAPLWVLLFLMHGVLGEGPRIAAPWGGTLSATGMAWAVEQHLAATFATGETRREPGHRQQERAGPTAERAGEPGHRAGRDVERHAVERPV